jgi:hypothetical protein
MSTPSMDAPDPEDPLFKQLEDISVDESELEDFYAYDDMTLLERFEQVTIAIKEAHQLLHPHEQGTRDLHSLRYAMQLELQRRGISIGLQ